MKSNSNPRENGSISTSFSKLILHDETPSIICQTRPDSPLLNNDKHTSPPGEQTSATQATPKAKNNVAEHGRKIQKQNSFTRWRYGSTSSTDSVFAAHENRTRESWFSDVYSHHSSMQSRSKNGIRNLSFFNEYEKNCIDVRLNENPLTRIILLKQFIAKRKTQYNLLSSCKCGK